MRNHLKKILITASLTLAACLLMGVATWTSSSTASGSAKAVCTVGNEGIAGPTSPTDGIPIGTSSASVGGFTVTLEMNIGVDAGAQNLVPAGVYMRAWLFNPNLKAPDAGVGGWWSPAPELDLGPTKGGKFSESWAGFKVTSPVGGSRLAYLPDSCGNVCLAHLNSTYAR